MAFREERTAVLATLIRQLGDFQLTADCAENPVARAELVRRAAARA